MPVKRLLLIAVVCSVAAWAEDLSRDKSRYSVRNCPAVETRSSLAVRQGIWLPEPPGAGPAFDPDVVIASGGRVASFDTDYEMDGTMWACFSLESDSTFRMYKSTDHGLTWPYFGGFYFTERFTSRILAFVVGEGDSNILHTFIRSPWNNGDLLDVRHAHDGAGLGTWNVLAGPDTITDFDACRDFSGGNYWLYCIVYNGLQTGGHKRGYIVRSEDFGKNWAYVDTTGNMGNPHIAAGAGAYIYAVGFPSQSSDPGYMYIRTSPSYGASGTWREHVEYQDNNYFGDAVIAAAFTLPDSLAPVWVVYSADYGGAPYDYDLEYIRSADGGLTWPIWTGIYGSPTTDDFEVDFANYTQVGNEWMNTSFVIKDRASGWATVFRTDVSASRPDSWSPPAVVSTSNVQGWINTGLRPRLVYTPGAGPGAGCVFVDSAKTRLLWNAPWFQPVAEPAGAGVTTSGLAVAPSPGSGRVRFTLPASTREVCVYDATGRLISAVPVPSDSRVIDWDRGELPVGTYLVRAGSASRLLVLY